MCNTRVLALLVLVVRSARPFSWDIVVVGDKQLEFYDNGTLTHTEDVPSAHYITSVTYDPVHYRVLFADYNYPTKSISSFDLSTRKIQTLVTRKSDGGFIRVVYEVVTQVLYWKNYKDIYSYSLNSASSTKADNGNVLVTLDDNCRDIAVDSCGGCKAGYSGDRCEVNACQDYCLNGGVCSLNEEHKRVCQCTADYDGERCEVSICKDYYFHGNCSVSAQGQPECSCMTGYSGERCEVNACHKYCLNDGVCSLNEEDEPACQCTPDYDGGRCEATVKHTGDCAGNTTQQVLRDLRSVVKQIIEELIRILQFLSGKIDEYNAKM